MIEDLKKLIGKLSIFAKDRIGFQHPPKLFLKQDMENSQKLLGRTAHYDPNNQSITLYITSRHPKDILRSFAHELVHHSQNLRGDLNPKKMGFMGKNYAQDNEHMRNMEKEAYLVGNLCFRDFEDGLEDDDRKLYKLAESKFLKEKNLMKVSELKQIIYESLDEAKARKKKSKKIKNPGPYMGGARQKAGQDDDGDGIPNGPDPDSTDGAIPKSKSKKKKSKSKTTKESKTMTTKITKEFLQETIKETLQKMMEQDAGPSHSMVSDIKIKNLLLSNEKYMKLSADKIFTILLNKHKRGRDPIALDATGYKAAKELVARKLPDIKRNIAKAKAKAKADAIARQQSVDTSIQSTLDLINQRKQRQSDNRPEFAPARTDESQIHTPEQEDALYEERFTPKNTRLYEKLLKEWTK